MGNDIIKSVLLTGATGFLGSHLLQILLDHNYTVIVLKRPTSNTWRIDHLKDKYLCYDIDTLSSYADIFQSHSIDAVVHVATEYGRKAPFSEVLKANVVWPVHLLEAGLNEGLKLFVNTDTFMSKSEKLYDYLNSYSCSKKMFQRALSLFAGKMKVVNMQLEHVYGEKDRVEKFVTIITRQLVNNVKRVELTEGYQKRDFVYVKDVAGAYIKVLENFPKLSSNDTFEVGTGTSISIREFVQRLHKVSRSSSTLMFGALPMREGEFESSCANTRLLGELGWTISTSLDEGIANVIKYESRFGN